MYPTELKIKDMTESNTSSSYLELLPSIGRNGKLRTSLYDKRDDFNTHITNFPFLSSNIPSSPAYGIFMSAHTVCQGLVILLCFILLAARLSSTLLGQGYCWWLKFRGVPIFMVFVEGPIYEFQYPRKSNFLYELWKKLLWPRMLNPSNVSFLFNPRKLVPTKIKPSTVCQGTFEIVPHEVLWSVWGSHLTLWSFPLPNVTGHSWTWPYTVSPSIDQTFH